MEETITEGGSTEISEPTQTEETTTEVQDDTTIQEETTETEVEGAEPVQAEPPVNWSELLKGKKAKAYGKEIELDKEIVDEAKLLERLNKGYSFDKMAQERAQMEKEMSLLKTQLDETVSRMQTEMSPEAIRKKALEDNYLREDLLFEELKGDMTPEEIQAFEAKRKAREGEVYKEKYDSLQNEILQKQQRAEQIQATQKHVENYAGMVHKGITEHPYLKHIQSNPMVSSEYLYWLKAAESKGLSTTPERLANHTWNSIMEKTVLPILEALPLDELSDKFQGFGKKWDEFKKSKIVNPDRATQSNGEGSPVKKMNAKSMQDVWENM
jgi:hypothetical protein